MPFDTPEEALLFDIKFAVMSFKYAPPPKSHRAEMSQWKETLAKHILEHLQRCQWDLQRRSAREMGAGAIIPPKD
jgi:hypothetical protein